MWRALVAAWAGLGLGYLYVGRHRLALSVPVVVVGVFAASGWTRLILEPWAPYAFGAIGLAVGLVPVVHAVAIARSRKFAPVTPMNRWWVYLAWVIASFALGQLLLDGRATLFGYEPFRIPSRSMAPTMQPGDYVMADTWRFDSEDPKLADLVVFELPDGSGTKYIYRIVGLPGDRIELRDSKLYRNGHLESEPYLSSSESNMKYSQAFGPVLLDDSSFFVLGDNRDNARDSRIIGPIHRSLLHGRVEYRWFSYAGGIRWDRFPERLSDDDT